MALALILVQADPPPVGPPAFITLHSPDNLDIAVNIAEVSSVRDPRPGQAVHTVHCVLVMTNRSFISVAEDCMTVHTLLKGKSAPAAHSPCTLVCGGTERP
jgi:hypothetical protein